MRTRSILHLSWQKIMTRLAVLLLNAILLMFVMNIIVNTVMVQVLGLLVLVIITI